MKPLPLSLCIGLLAASHSPSAMADRSPEELGFPRENWTVSAWYCPLHCPEGIKAYLQARVGSKATLSNTKIDIPFLDHCDGETRVEFSWTSAGELARELERGRPPGQGLTARDIRLPDDQALLRADAYCLSGGTKLPFARFLSVEADRLQLLFEEQSILELR